MKNLFLFLLLILLMLFACSSEKEKVTLEPGTPSYVFATDLAKIVPSIDPDSNKVIVETTSFVVTTGEIVDIIFKNFGKNAAELQKMPPDRIKGIIETNAEKLAERKLILAAAKEEGILTTDDEVDSILQAQYQRFGGESLFVDYVTKSGMTIELVKVDIAEGMMTTKYMENVLARESGISDEELQNKYRQLIQKDQSASVQHILLMTQGKPDPEKASIYKKMKKILARARAGEDFGKLAQEYSEDPGSKDRGGLYENFERGTMVKPFEDAAFTVPIGELSDIIETRYGYHILKVIDRKKETRSFEEVKLELTKKLADANKGDISTAHIAILKEKYSYQKYSL
jgi:parvulin-like peptidyl-prolyl isomerase